MRFLLHFGGDCSKKLFRLNASGRTIRTKRLYVLPIWRGVFWIPFFVRSGITNEESSRYLHVQINILDFHLRCVFGDVQPDASDGATDFWHL